MNQERILLTSSKALAEVLVTRNYDFPKPEQMRYSIGRILGVGVLLAEGDEHKMQRKHLMPAFAFRHVKDLYSVFWGKSRECVQAMTDSVLRDSTKEPQYQDSAAADNEKSGEKLPSGTAVLEVGSWASRVTLDIIGVAGLGRDFGAIKDPDNELTQTYARIFRPSRQSQILALLAQVIPGWIVNLLPVKRNEDIGHAVKVIRATCRDLIQQKRVKIANKEPADVDILSVAIESGGFSDENLVDQLMTFLAAGHETTASAMTWAIYLLCTHPEAQARLRAEVRERLPSPADAAASVSSVDVDHMPYLNAVCSEVLRYYSPVPITLRVAGRDTTILGHKVPKGTRVMLTPWAVNKSQDMWGADALRFDPERWLGGGGSGGASSNYAFLTFLHGPRGCIGSGFAKAEFACLLAAWVGRFEFALNDPEQADERKLDIRSGVTAHPRKGLYVKAKVVEGW